MIILTDHNALICPAPSPALLTSPVRRVLEEVGVQIKKQRLWAGASYEEVAGGLLGCAVSPNDQNGCGGYYNVRQNRIAFNTGVNTLAREREVFCHELGHAVQRKAEHFAKVQLSRPELLSTLINEEQQANTIGIILSQLLYPAYPIGAGRFLTCFGLKDWMLLNNYYGKTWAENDLFINNSPTE